CGDRMPLPVLIIALLMLQRLGVPDAYRARVDAYRAGTEVSDADLGIHPVALEDANRWTPEDLQAAAMLHTDVCLRLVRIGRAGEARSQLDAASMLLRAAVAGDAAIIDYARRWRDTVA